MFKNIGKALAKVNVPEPMRSSSINNLSDLFYEARSYGRVYIYTSDNGKYNCSIKFATIKHIELTANSKYDHATVEEAILLAIYKAKEIAETIGKVK